MQEVVLDVKGVNKGHYSAGIFSNGTLYISGQLSLDLDTREVVQGSSGAHMRKALENVERVLHAAGLGRENVVMCRVYVADMDNWDEVNEEYKIFFGAHKPARIIISAKELHFGCKVEIEAVAEV
ncbi:MAG: RidA family protein [Sphaerochaetaceae bacterium]|nr:RidA family protein [Sphaerochaetaceae bacterium]